MDFRWDIAVNATPVLLKGALMTLNVSMLTIVIATITGTFVALMRLSNNPVAKGVAAFYVWLMRGTPVLLILFFVYYAFPSFGIRIDAFPAAILGLSLNATAYTSEIIRSGISAVPRGQVEAAMAIGMSYGQTMRRIVLPQAARIILPPYINNAILLLKNSSLVSAITVADLMLTSTQLYSSTFRPFEILSVTAVLYLIMTSFLMIFQSWAEKRMAYYSR